MFPMILHRWISVGSDLKFDARRDLDDVGATCIDGIFFDDFMWIMLYYISKFCGVFINVCVFAS